jgi:hypothetical protein
MVPISRAKQVAGVVVLAALGYALSWAYTPSSATGPEESFAPVVATPQESAPSDHDGTVTTSKPSHSYPNALQEQRYKPI